LKKVVESLCHWSLVIGSLAARHWANAVICLWRHQGIGFAAFRLRLLFY
jgi:hypothetical protein